MFRRMIVGRIVGWIFLLAGLSALVRDALVLVDTGRWLPLGLGEGWGQIAPASYRRFIGWGLPFADDALAIWAFALLIGLGLVLLLRFRRRRPPLAPAPRVAATFLPQ